MATGTLGSVSIDVEARLAKFESDMGRAARLAEKEFERMRVQVSRQLERLNRTASETANKVQQTFRRAFGGIGIALVVRELKQAADGYANVQAKLKLVTTDSQQLGRVTEQVFAIAKRTYTTMDSVATLTSRTTRALISNGADAQTALAKSLRLTETINQAFAVSGAGQAEQQAAIIQLSQGLASGVLRGEEFNSVAEQGSRISQALAESLGVTTGELRALAKQGKLTTDVVVEGLLSQADKIASEFSQVPLTIGRAMTVARAEFEKWVGTADQASGTSRKVAESIVYLAEHLDQIVTVLGLVGAAYALAFGSKVLRGIQTVTTALYANSVAALAAQSAAVEMGIAVAGTSTATFGLAAVGRGLLAVIGGWPGVILAAAAGLAYLVVTLNEESQAVKDLDAAIVAVRDSHGTLAPAVEESARAAAAAAQELALLKQAQIEQIEAQQRMVVQGADTHDQFLALQVRSEALRGEVQTLGEKLDELQFEQLKKRVAGAVSFIGTMIDTAVNFREKFAASLNVGSDALDKETAKLEKHAREVGKTKVQILEMAKAEEIAAAAAKYGVEQGTASHTEIVRVINEKYAAVLKAAAADEAATAATKKNTSAERDRSKALRETQKEAAKAQRDLAKMNADDLKLVRAYQADLTRFNASFDNLIDSYRDEIAMLGVSEEARARTNIMLRAEADIRQLNEQAVRDGIAAGDAEIAQKEQQIRANAEMLASAAELSEAAKPYQQAWEGAISSVAGAFGDWVSRGFKGWKGFLDSMKQTLQRWVADVISIMTQRALMNAFGGMFGGGGITGAVMQAAGGAMGSGGGGGAGGFAGIAGSGSGGLFSPSSWMSAGRNLYSGFQSAWGGGVGTGSNMMGTWYTGANGNVWNMSGTGMALGAAAGLYAGYNRYQNSNGGAAGVAGAAAYGLGTYGVAAGLGSMAAGGGFAAGMSGAFAIPVVGWIAAIAMLVDMVSGGKLFGTKYATKGFESAIRVAEGGGSASLQARQTRQAALFGGIRTRFKDVDPGDQARATAQQVQDIVEGVWRQSAQRLGIEVGNVVSGAFRQTLDKKGNVKEEWSEVLGKKYKETFEQFQKRIAAEQAIAAANAVDATASGLAEQFRANADQLADAAETFIAILADIKDGVGLLGSESSLSGVLDLVKELGAPGEALAATYQRLAVSTKLLDQAMSIMGLNLGKTREEVVRFAAGIADAAGGLEQATSLWNSFFENFYSQAERGRASLDQAQGARNSQLGALGLDPNISREEFRAEFERRLPTLTADEVVQWLKGAQAIVTAGQALSAYAESIGLSAGALESYGAFVAALNAELDPRPVSQYQAVMADLREQQRILIAEANRLARAEGLAGASTEDIAKIMELMARKAADALRQLERSARAIADELFGSPLELIESQISSAEQARSAYEQAQQAAQEMYEAQLAGIRAVKQAADDLLLGDLSPLRGRAKVSEAMRQLQEAAASGDAERVRELANTTLGIGRTTFASGSDYRELFDQVQSILRNFGSNVRPPVAGGGGFDYAELQRLYDERDRLLAEQEAQHRRDLATDLIGFLEDIALATGQSVAAVAASFGFTLEALADIMGITVEELLSRVRVPEFTAMPTGTSKPDQGDGVVMLPRRGEGGASITAPGAPMVGGEIPALLRQLIRAIEEDRLTRGTTNAR